MGGGLKDNYFITEIQEMQFPFVFHVQPFRSFLVMRNYLMMNTINKPEAIILNNLYPRRSKRVQTQKLK